MTEVDRERAVPFAVQLSHYITHPHSRFKSIMSLAEASEARKARLIALRKRKAGETADGYVQDDYGHIRW